MDALTPKKTYEITLSGCDDDTLIEKDLTDKELNFLIELAKQVNAASKSRCMPTLKIEDKTKVLATKESWG